MYFLDLHFENARRNRDGHFRLRRYRETVGRWTVLPAGPGGREILQLFAAAAGGADFLSGLRAPLERLVRKPELPVHVELVLADHRPGLRSVLSASGVRIDASGACVALDPRECRLAPREVRRHRLALGSGNSGSHLLLGYAPGVKAHEGTDRFDFSDPLHRVTRFAGLFTREARTTDPVAFLTRLHYRAVKVSRFPAQDTMTRLCEGLGRHLGIETERWGERSCSFAEEWSRQRGERRRGLLVVLDLVRHLVDASPRSGRPLDEPGVVLLDRPDLICRGGLVPFLRLLGELAPSVQFLLTLPERVREALPSRLLSGRLDLPDPRPPGKRAAEPRQVPGDTVVLIDVDGRLPNLALMKLGRHFKDEGRRVVLARKECRIRGAGELYASTVFHRTASLARVERLRERYGDALTVGGSGVDLDLRLPPAIERLPADYSLYPELGDRAIGFLTRGCPGRCAFCIVPAKEGSSHRDADLMEVLQGRKKLILLDDNLLAHPEAGEILEEMVRRGIRVNFNQTLDILRVDREKAELLRRVRSSNVRFTRSMIHFSLNDTRRLEAVRRSYARLGFGREDNVEFVCMYGFDTTLAEDVERFRFLRTLPGAYVFVQRYQPCIGGPAPDLSGFFDDRADERIDDLIGILFPQNMKSMETYYRWLSERYFEAFGKIHERLVDTIFRYNYRHRKGRYLESLRNKIVCGA